MNRSHRIPLHLWEKARMGARRAQARLCGAGRPRSQGANLPLKVHNKRRRLGQARLCGQYARESWGKAKRGGYKLWSGRGDSNPRPLPWQGSALPLSYSRSQSAAQSGAEGQNRTDDTSIFSAVLYQLSYLGKRPASYNSTRRAARLSSRYSLHALSLI